MKEKINSCFIIVWIKLYFVFKLPVFGNFFGLQFVVNLSSKSRLRLSPFVNACFKIVNWGFFANLASAFLNN